MIKMALKREQLFLLLQEKGHTKRLTRDFIRAKTKVEGSENEGKEADIFKCYPRIDGTCSSHPLHLHSSKCGKVTRIVPNGSKTASPFFCFHSKFKEKNQ